MDSTNPISSPLYTNYTTVCFARVSQANTDLTRIDKLTFLLKGRPVTCSLPLVPSPNQ